MVEPVKAVTPRYATVSIILHWLIAALLIFEVGLGLGMSEVRGAAKFAVFQVHKSVGITILLLVALRLLWRFYKHPPASTATGWERMLAHAVHASFYLVLFAMPISGWLIVSTSRIAVPTLLYGVIPWPNLPGFDAATAAVRESWNDAAGFTHVNMVKLIYVLFALHLAGALKHHLIDRDGTLARMVPGVRTGAWFDPRLVAIGIGVVAAINLGWQWAPRASAAVAAPAVAPVAAPPVAPVGPVATTPEVPPVAAEPVVAAPPADAAAPATPEKTGPVSWQIAKGSTLHFRTSWSGDAVEGGFTRFDGTIDFDPDALDASRVAIAIDTGSVFSGDPQRDETLKGADWFAVAAQGSARFTADRFTRLGAGRYLAAGSLTLKGVTLPLSFPFTLDIAGRKATMRGTATLDRTAYKIGEGEFAATTNIPAAVRVEIVVVANRK